jgi:capsular polysaccharide transport system permease protein
VHPMRAKAINDMRHSWRLRYDVLAALMRRDLIVRYGRDNIGFAWMFVEPMILTLGVMAIWSVIKSPFENGVQVIILVLTGYMPLTLFRHITSSVLNIFKASSSLLYHYDVNIYNLLISKIIVEIVGTTTAFIVIFFTLNTLGSAENIEDLRIVITSWLLMASLSTGIAMIFSGLTEMQESIERFVQAFQYLMVPLSGAFYMLNWLPSTAQDILLWNPFVHVFESMRDGFYGSSTPTFYSFTYLAIWCAIINGLGLWLMTIGRKHMQI